MNLSEVSMYQACLMHSRAERVLKGYVSRQLEVWDITRMEWLVLASVAETPQVDAGHTMGEIADQLDVRLSQLTALVTKMIATNLVTQKVAEHDRRTRYLAITPKGRKLLDEIETTMRSAMREWLGNIPKDRLAIYLRTVEELGSETR